MSILVSDIIISLDGDEATHNMIRNIPDAFQKTSDGIRSIREIDSRYLITGRTVIHRLNFRQWPAIIEAAKEMGLRQISFLPADISSHAFNREVLWSEQRQHEILPTEEELGELLEIIHHLITTYKKDFETGFIAESPEKLIRIYHYYAAFYGLNEFPYKKCNAPWVSTVVEADGTVRPCFFHPPLGNIRENTLEEILNSKTSIGFRN